MKEDNYKKPNYGPVESIPDPDEDLSMTSTYRSESLRLAPALQEVPSLYEAHRRPKGFETEETFLFILPLCDHLRISESSRSFFAVSRNELLFVPSFTHVSISSPTGEGGYIVIHFGPSIQLCNGICPRGCQDGEKVNKADHCGLERDPQGEEHAVTSLPLKAMTTYWRQSLHECLRVGIRSLPYYEFKLRELFFIFREFYNRDETDEFLKLFHCNNYGFRAFVFRHHWDCKSVEELADLAGLSLSTFKRIFKEEFRTSPLRWINGQKATYLRRDLEETDTPLSDLAAKYNFSSVSYLCAFSKKMLGETPHVIRQKRDHLD